MINRTRAFCTLALPPASSFCLHLKTVPYVFRISLHSTRTRKPKDQRVRCICCFSCLQASNVAAVDRGGSSRI